MNPKHVVARWWISGFNVTFAQSGSIWYVSENVDPEDDFVCEKCC